MESPTDFELDQWEKEAKRLVMCTDCFGVGQKHWSATDRWELCPVCEGLGKAAAEPHVLRLVAEVRTLRGTDEEP